MSSHDGLPAEPFANWIRNCGLGAFELSRLGLDSSYRNRLLAGEVDRVGLALVDRVLTRAGWPLELVYPADDYPEDPRPPYCHEYELGASISELAARHHYSFESMRYRLKKEGVQLRPRGGRRGGAHYSGLDYVESALKAAEARAGGQTWVRIARELGYSTPQAAQRAVAYHLSLTSKDFNGNGEGPTGASGGDCV